VIPPEKLPEAMRTAGKVLRELRLASNTIVRELASAIDEPYPPPVHTPMTRPNINALPPADAPVTEATPPPEQSSTAVTAAHASSETQK
jgi:Sec-independent protein translocase protein TatA